MKVRTIPQMDIHQALRLRLERLKIENNSTQNPMVHKKKKSGQAIACKLMRSTDDPLKLRFILGAPNNFKPNCFFLKSAIKYGYTYFLNYTKLLNSCAIADLKYAENHIQMLF